MDASQLFPVLMSQLWSLPYVLAYVAGIGMSLVYWRRHPGVSMCAASGFLILLGTIVLGIGINIWFSIGDGSAIDRGRILTITGILRSVVSMIAYGFLLAAIFGWRTVDRKQF